jgi:hypothetical protein
MQHFDISLPPGTAREINVQGSYVYFLEGSAGGADATIELRNVSGSDTVLLKPGQAFNMGGGAENVRWIVSNYKSQGTIIGRLLMGSGEFSDNRISGTVDVVDGAKNRVLSEMAFTGYGYQAGAAGNYAHVQLWNPPGSGKNVYVEQLNFFSGSAFASGVAVRSAVAALTNLGEVMHSKKMGGADSGAAQLRIQSNAAPIGVKNLLNMSGTLPTFKFSEPMLIVPGTGINLYNGNLAADLAVTFETFEETI